MALSSNAISDALQGSVEILYGDQFKQAQRVDRAIASDGSIIIDPPMFWRIRTEDGSIYRIKCSNAGVLSTALEP